ncbi:VTT domain-containing protein [Paenibacillus sp. TRM 82003]|nr:VTT domain-containing protein [Paenibacillus sp. TRM 82003]
MLQNILEWLENFGVWGLAIHSFIDAIFFPIPAFFLQVSLSMVNPSTALLLATVGYIACLLGTPFGYWIGRTVGNALMEKLLKKSWVDAAHAMFTKSGETAILIGSFTPIPFKVFTILSGSLNYPLWKLMAYASVGRAVKFYAVGILFYMYGRAAEGMVKDVTTYIAVGAVSLIAFFLFIRKQWKKKSKRQVVSADQDS